jgi:hypothetical protein
VKARLLLCLLGAPLGWAACTLDRSGSLDDLPTSSAGGGDTMPASTSVGGAGGDPQGPGGGPPTTTGGGGPGGGPPVEADCTNGIDDDGDALTDCDDDECTSAGYGCIAPLPNMIAQIVRAGSCPAMSTPRPLRTCDDTACNCAGTPGTCQFSVDRWDGGTCDGQPSSFPPKTTPGCYVFNGGSSSFLGTTTSDNNATCPPSAPPVAAGEIGACEVTGGSCANGGACVAQGFPANDACILLPAGSQCTSPYVHGYRVFDDASPTCSCSCTFGGAACAGDVDYFNASSCGGTPLGSVPIDGQCHPVGNINRYRLEPVPLVPTCGANASMNGIAVLCCLQP